VIDALTQTLGAIDDALRPTRPGHALLDLGALAARALAGAGVASDDIGRLPDTCTRCDALRFHSYRRDGPRAGRLVLYVAAAQA
jgi:copper oxidase (laccase) domain-containing protein